METAGVDVGLVVKTVAVAVMLMGLTPAVTLSRPDSVTFHWVGCRHTTAGLQGCLSDPVGSKFQKNQPALFENQSVTSYPTLGGGADHSGYSGKKKWLKIAVDPFPTVSDGAWTALPTSPCRPPQGRGGGK